MIENFFLILGLSIGLGALLPRLGDTDRPQIGLMAFSGFCLLAVEVYFLMVVLRLGFGSTFVAVSLSALSGLLLRRRSFADALRRPVSYLHPVFILAGAIGIAIWLSAPIEFLPYGDDTYANWLSHAKQIWLVNGFHSALVEGPGVGYLPGWHLLMAFSSPWGTFSDARVLGLSAAMHIALLGLIYDVCRLWMARSCPQLSEVQTGLAGYLIILFLLAAETSWRLVPTLVLTEMPLFYSLIGVAMLVGLYQFTGNRSVALSVLLGIALGCHYAIKVQGIAAVPAAAAIAYFFNSGSFQLRPVSRNMLHAAIIAAPAILVALSWSALGPQSAKCVTNLSELLSFEQGWSGIEPALTLIFDIVATAGAYLSTYKVPVSVVAVTGIAIAIFVPRLRLVGGFVILYFVVYLAALFWVYFSCPDSFNTYLSSILRYLQLPVRLLHTAGAVVLALSAIYFSASRWPALLGRTGMIRAAVSLVLLAGAYQIHMVRASMRVINDPPLDAAMKHFIAQTPVDVENIMKLMSDRRIERPRVVMAYIFWEDLPLLVARHAFLPNRRNDLNDDAGLSRASLEDFRFERSDTRIGLLPDRIFAADESVRPDVIWSMQNIDQMSEIIAGLIDDPKCVSALAGFFVVRKNFGSKDFECVERQRVQ